MKKPIAFKHQVAAAEKAMADVFSNTNVLRSATRGAMVGLKEMAESFIAALDDDDANGVKDESGFSAKGEE